jgi:acyl-CoA thioesterase I
VRRKLAVLLGVLALFAVAGGIAGGAVAFGGSDQPDQRQGLAAQENWGVRQRGDRAGRPPGAGQPLAAGRSSGVSRAPATGQPGTGQPGTGRPGTGQPGTARPLLAVVGASFSAGVGAGHPGDAWPEDLARIMHWRLIVSADPGAGYVNPGEGDRGPFSRLAARLNLARTHPQTVIIQGGHDDIGRPLPLIRQRVRSLIAAIRRQSPGARLVLLTVFPRGNNPPAAVWATDQAIVHAARQADPAVLIFDPLAGHWHFPRIGDHLHPTPAGHRWIAERLAAGLRGHQVVA